MAINYSQIAAGAYGRPDDLYLATIGMICTGLVFAFLASRVNGKAGVRLLTVLAVGVFLLFSSVALRGLLRSAGVTEYSTLITAGGMFGALVIVWLLSRLEPVRVLVSLASVIALAMALTGLAPQLLAGAGSGDAELESSEGSAHALSGENVYIVVVDEYAGENTLRDLGFDNRPFVEEMRKRGFSYDPKARTNYIATHVSLMSILEGGYPVTEASDRYPDRSPFYPAAINNGYAPRLVRDLAASGYSTHRISNWWGRCSDAVFDNCIESPDTTQSYAIQTFLEPTIVSSLASAVAPIVDVRRDAALEMFQDQFSRLRQASPYFMLIHHLSPHPPYSRNADCTVRDVPESDKSLTPAERAPLFIAATQCVNAELIRTADLIAREDPTAIVIIFSDHGSDLQVDWHAPIDGWSEAALAERTEILSLLKLPDACNGWIKEGLGQANIIRLVWGCLTRTPPEFLQEHTYVTAYEYHPEFGLVAKVR